MGTSWITPYESWVAGAGIGFTDMNRIESNIDYIYNTGIFTSNTWNIKNVATFSGTAINMYKPVTFSSDITQTAGVTSLKATTIDNTLTISATDGTESLSYKDSGSIKLVASYYASNDAYRILMNDTTYKQAFAIFRDTQNVSIGENATDSGYKLNVGGKAYIEDTAGADILTLMNTNTSSTSRLIIRNGTLNATFGVGNTTNASSSIAGRQYLYGATVEGISLIAGSSSKDIKMYGGLSSEIASFSELAITMYQPLTINDYALIGTSIYSGYKLDVAGTLRATGAVTCDSGIKVGSTGDLITSIEWVA